MMRVALKYPWFSNGDGMVRDGRPMSGRFYPKGEHDMPEELRDYLPRSAKIMEGTTKKTLSPLPTLRDFDESRPALVAEAEVHAKVNRGRPVKEA